VPPRLLVEDKSGGGSSKGCVLEAGAIFFMKTERFDRLTIPNAVEGPSKEEFLH
jgi:hypothetical protein